MDRLARKARAERYRPERARETRGILRCYRDRTRMRRILAEVAAEADIPVSLLVAKHRSRRNVALRMAQSLAAYRLYTETRLSFPAVGKLMGGRDHTTVLHLVRRYCKDTGKPWPKLEKRGIWYPEGERT